MAVIPNDDQQHRERFEYSVESLVGLYLIVIGLALAAAVADLIPAVRAGLDAVVMQNEAAAAEQDQAGLCRDICLAAIAHVLLFFTFAVTVTPFVHGMNVHIASNYLVPTRKPSKKRRLFVDFTVFLIESVLIYGMVDAMSCKVLPETTGELRHPDPHVRTFLVWWSLLFAVDIAWKFTRELLPSDSAGGPKASWAWNNVLFSVPTVGIAFFILSHPDVISSERYAPIIAAGTLAVASAARTARDYTVNWDWYFGGEVTRSGSAAAPGPRTEEIPASGASQVPAAQGGTDPGES